VAFVQNSSGVEKLNDNVKRRFFRSSNKHDPAADFLKDDYKLDYLKGYARKKNTHT